MSAAAFQFFFVESASLGAAAASTCALNLVDSGFGILGVQVHEEVFPLQEVLSHTQKEALALVLNGVLLLFFHYVSLVLFCIAAAAFQRLAKVVNAYLSAASTAAAFVLLEVFCGSDFHVRYYVAFCVGMFWDFGCCFMRHQGWAPTKFCCR